MSRITAFEPREFTQEGEMDLPSRAISLFGDDQFRLPPLLCPILFIFGIVSRTHEETDDIGVLFDGAIYDSTVLAR